MSFSIMGAYRISRDDTFYHELAVVLKECNPNKELSLMGDLHVNWGYKCKSKKTNLIKFDQIHLIFTNKQERITKSYNFNQCTIA